MLRRVGVLGGTFDPPHYGHLRAAELARELVGLDEVVFMPAYRPPHKTGNTVSPVEHRLAMLRDAVAPNANFSVSTLELEREGPSFTIDTLDTLSELARAAGKSERFFFLIGSDAFAEITTWKDWQRLLSDYDLVLLARPGTDISEAVRELPETWTPDMVAAGSSSIDESAGRAGPVQLVDEPLLSISATDIRGRIRSGSSIRYLLPEIVASYIEEHRLYR